MYRAMAKVLIVDDEKSIRKTLRDILEFENYEVDEATNGLDCVVKIKQNKYDVIVLDIKMPKMDGMDALERIQDLAVETPVVMISGHATIDTAVDAVKKGAFDFISKPPDLNRLLITLRNALDKSSLITEKKVLQRQILTTPCRRFQLPRHIHCHIIVKLVFRVLGERIQRGNYVLLTLLLVFLGLLPLIVHKLPDFLHFRIILWLWCRLYRLLTHQHTVQRIDVDTKLLNQIRNGLFFLNGRPHL